MATGEEKTLTDCYWFLQNQCAKGTSCEYRHCQSALENSTTCKFWMEGKCTNQNCKFRHPSGVHNVKDRSQTPCYYFIQGKCTKGEACPFSHSLPGAVTAVDTELKKKEEEELRKLQLERKREEERLDRLKAEREKLEMVNQRKKKNPPQQLQNEVENGSFQQPKKKKSATNVGATFVKSFDEIIKEKAKEKGLKKGASLAQNKEQKAAITPKTKKADKPTKKAVIEKPAKKEITEKPAKKEIIEKPAKKGITEKLAKKDEKDKQNVEIPSGPVNFGIKSLDQIMKERQDQTSNGENTEKPEVVNTPAPVKIVQPTSNYVEELRKKNQQKFRLSPVSTKTDAPKEAPIVKEISPKKKLTEEPNVVQRIVKKQKVEQPEPKIASIVKSPSVDNLKKSVSTGDMEDDFDKELADLGVDVTSVVGVSEDLDGDDFDKEFEDIMNN